MSLRHHALALLLRGLLGLLRGLGPVGASNLGGAVARWFGPRLRVSRIAHANLGFAWPALDHGRRAAIVRGMWDNLGRTVAEMAHLDRYGPTSAGPGWELLAHPEAVGAATARGAIYCMGHLANWEVMPQVLSSLAAGRVGIFYRASPNLRVDRLVRDLRDRAGGPGLEQFAKGAAGARAGLRHLRGGGVLGMLMDQKANDGIAAPLFGHPAMTASAPASLALRHGVPMVPMRIERLGPARLRITLEQPLCHPDTGDRHADIAALTAAMNGRLESWIRARPADWLWVHRRWPKTWYAEAPNRRPIVEPA